MVRPWRRRLVALPRFLLIGERLTCRLVLFDVGRSVSVPGLDPCCAFQTPVELRAGASVEIVFLLGQGGGADEVRTLIERYRKADLDAVLAEVTRSWEDVTGALQVKTPDRSMDLLLNRWLLYQTLSCRVWARSAFYQAGGAFGFRDQLQDVLALTVARR